MKKIIITLCMVVGYGAMTICSQEPSRHKALEAFDTIVGANKADMQKAMRYLSLVEQGILGDDMQMKYSALKDVHSRWKFLHPEKDPHQNLVDILFRLFSDKESATTAVPKLIKAINFYYGKYTEGEYTQYTYST